MLKAPRTQARLSTPENCIPKYVRAMPRQTRAAAIAQLNSFSRVPMRTHVGISRVARILLQDDYDFTRQKLDGETVFLRVNFNVPRTSDGEVLDWWRVESVLPTIRVLQQKGARVVIGSHLGGSHIHFGSDETLKATYSLKLVQDRLVKEFGEAFLGVTESPVGSETSKRIADLAPGQILLLENLRFHSGDTLGDPELAKLLAQHVDVFINDAFGISHRHDASSVGICEHAPRLFPGMLMRAELQRLLSCLDPPQRPFAVVLGGDRVPETLTCLSEAIFKADKVIVGGLPAYTLLAARGHSLGRTHVDHAYIDRAAGLIRAARNQGVELLLPTDLVHAPCHLTTPNGSAAPREHTLTGNIDVMSVSFDPYDSAIHTLDIEEPPASPTHHEHGVRVTQTAGGMPEDDAAADIGPATRDAYAAALRGCQTILWTGPMGLFEGGSFSGGTVAVAKAIAAETADGATSIVGGGASVAAVRSTGMENRFTHLLTAGAAMLAFLDGRDVPGLWALLKHDNVDVQAQNYIPSESLDM